MIYLCVPQHWTGLWHTSKCLFGHVISIVNRFFSLRFCSLDMLPVVMCRKLCSSHVCVRTISQGKCPHSLSIPYFSRPKRKMTDNVAVFFNFPNGCLKFQTSDIEHVFRNVFYRYQVQLKWHRCQIFLILHNQLNEGDSIRILKSNAHRSNSIIDHIEMKVLCRFQGVFASNYHTWLSQSETTRRVSTNFTLS